MYDPSARYYDKIYAFKDYAAETDKLLAIIEKNHPTPAKTLLDVACGTGKHIAQLKQHFTVEGLDQSAGLLDLARAAHPQVTFHQGDMRAFDLGRTFDVVTCLFSSIGYMKTVEELGQAITCMARHLAPGGVLIVEPWFAPEAWHPGFVHAMLVEEPELKVARMSTSMAEGNLSFFDFHFLVGTPRGVEHFVEHHEMGLFTVSQMQAAVTGAGLRSELDPVGLDGRGLHIGVKSM